MDFHMYDFYLLHSNFWLLQFDCSELSITLKAPVYINTLIILSYAGYLYLQRLPEPRYSQEYISCAFSHRTRISVHCTLSCQLCLLLSCNGVRGDGRKTINHLRQLFCGSKDPVIYLLVLLQGHITSSDWAGCSRVDTGVIFEGKFGRTLQKFSSWAALGHYI